MVTSRLDAVVASQNVLRPVAILTSVYKNHTVYSNYLNIIKESSSLRTKSFKSDADSFNSAEVTAKFISQCKKDRNDWSKMPCVWKYYSQGSKRLLSSYPKGPCLESYMLGLCESDLKQSTHICSRHFPGGNDKQEPSLSLGEQMLLVYISDDKFYCMRIINV